MTILSSRPEMPKDYISDSSVDSPKDRIPQTAFEELGIERPLVHGGAVYPACSPQITTNLIREIDVLKAKNSQLEQKLEWTQAELAWRTRPVVNDTAYEEALKNWERYNLFAAGMMGLWC